MAGPELLRDAKIYVAGHRGMGRTGMKTDAEIRQEGMRALVQSLGAVEAERFVASLSKDRFDYTEWRRNGLEVEVDTLSTAAAEFSRQLDN